MKMGLIALAQRLPAWAQAACDDFSKRLPPHWQFSVHALKAQERDGKNASTLMRLEAERIEQTLSKHFARDALRVALDERGRAYTSAAWAEQLSTWLQGGRDVVFVIGGADGLAPEFKAQCAHTIKLSDMTLPHAMARVVLLEQLYRGHSILTNHPYHRE